MGWFKSLLGFENSFSKNFLKDLGNDPSRLITGVDPLSTGAWNGVLGTHKQPLVNMYGSPGPQYSQKYAEEGGDPTAGQQFSTLADTIAGFYGGKGLSKLAGAGMSNLRGLDTGNLTATDMGLAPEAGESAIPGEAGLSADGLADYQGMGASGTDLASAGSSGGGFGLGGNTSDWIKGGLKVGSSLYDMYTANKKSKAMQSQADQLSNMYQPGTPEYDMWKQQLERRDAAAGRRSQYGPRSVELAAAMAKQRSNNLQSQNYANFTGGALTQKYGGLDSLFKNAGSIYDMYKKAPGIWNAATNSVSNGLDAYNYSDNAYSAASDLYSQGDGIMNALF